MQIYFQVLSLSVHEASVAQMVDATSFSVASSVAISVTFLVVGSSPDRDVSFFSLSLLSHFEECYSFLPIMIFENLFEQKPTYCFKNCNFCLFTYCRIHLTSYICSHSSKFIGWPRFVRKQFSCVILMVTIVDDENMWLSLVPISATWGAVQFKTKQ